ncbi:MAG: hypothetical protein JWP40_2390 [Blastococcus sp.]|nr:hypothetical protein [Blastococcus sp.]
MDWFVAFATVGTAIGTLALALYTYRLAQSTRESVKGADRLIALANSQLEEVQSQRKLVAEQAAKSGIQAEETRRVADASEASAMEAARARIDAIAPLIHMTIRLAEMHLQNVVTRERRPLQADDKWYEPQLRELLVQVELDFVLHNVGRSPAQIQFNYTLEGLVAAAQNGLHSMSLDPGETYEDRLVVRLTPDELKGGKLLGLQLTYDGMIHGEVFDHIQLNGWVTPLKAADGVWSRNDAQWMINAGAATIIRSYPNLERPEEMAEVRKRLLNPHSG